MSTEAAIVEVEKKAEPLFSKKNKKLISISSALEVDLTGQVCSDSVGYRFYSGIGDQVDFLRREGRDDRVDIGRLGQVLARAELHGLDGRGNAPVAGQHHRPRRPRTGGIASSSGMS